MVFRIQPAMGVQSYKTYQATFDRSKEPQSASCEAVDCDAYRNGWITRIDETTDLGRRQADYIRRNSGRYFTEVKDAPGAVTEFRFTPLQKCFANHVIRPALHLVRGGDWRGDTGLIRKHSRVADWVEDFAEHQDQIKTQIERG